MYISVCSLKPKLYVVRSAAPYPPEAGGDSTGVHHRLRDDIAVTDVTPLEALAYDTDTALGRLVGVLGAWKCVD